MPSSYTPLLRLVLPVTGELTGTWGDTVNNGITALVEAAIAGTASVVMTDANYTLTTANEATDEARQAIISLTGTLTAARNVICPTSSKLYLVRNATTGGFGIVFKTVAGSGITVANGETRFLRCDGTNVVEAFNAFTGNLTGNVSGTATNVTGIVAVANGGTGSATVGPGLANLGAIAADTQAKTGAYTVVAADRGDIIWCDGTFSLSLTAAATLADGFSFGVVNTGTGTITLDPSGAETVDGAATKSIAAGQSAFVITDGTSWRTIGQASGDARVPLLFPITASVASSALTLTLNPTTLDFRSSTLTSGTVNTRTVAAAISLVISSGSTLGTINAQASRIVLLAIDNAGTVELAAVNLAGGVNLDETGLISTTAEGGAGAADSATVIYSTTARTNVPYRVVGYVESTQTTAGTWATAPSTIAGAGGQVMGAMQSLGFTGTYQLVTRTSGVTYYNTTGKPLDLVMNINGAGSASCSVSININGAGPFTFVSSSAGTGPSGSAGSVRITPGASYVLTETNVTARNVYELR